MLIHFLTLDPSLRNMGLATGVIHTQSDIINIHHTDVIKTKPNPQDKQNIQDMTTAYELFTGLKPLVEQADIIFVELPNGSQSSRAMVSYAVCVALIGALHYYNKNIIPITPQQVKKFITQQTQVTNPQKQDVINWVQSQYPTLKLTIKSKAEHIADAITAMHVGLTTPQYLEYLYETNTKHQ